MTPEELERRVRNKNTDSGTYIRYHTGDFSDEIGKTAIGLKARELYDEGRVGLYQKLVSQEPRTYDYLVRKN